MVNQQKGVQQEFETAYIYSAVVVNDHNIIYISFYDPISVKNHIYGRGYIISIHYRQFLVALVFADLPSRFL